MSDLHIHPPPERGLEKRPYKSSYRLPIERFDHRRGLNSLQIHQSLCSPDGRVWSATPAGLACYDGVRIRIFGRRQGLSSHGLRTVFVHPDGTLWIGSDVGYEILDIQGPDLKIIRSENIGTVNTIGGEENAGLIGTARGLYIAKPGENAKPIANALLARETIHRVISSGPDCHWVVGARAGLARINTDGEIFDTEYKKAKIGAPTSLAALDDDHVLIGGSGGIASMSNAGKLIDSISAEKSVSAMDYNSGRIWVGHGNSLSKVRYSHQKFSDPEIVRENLSVNHIMLDRFANVWISTSGQALLRISSMRNTFDGSADPNVGPVLSIRKTGGDVIIGGSKGLSLPQRDTILTSLAIWDVLTDDFGKVWLATQQGLYCSINPSVTIPYRHKDSRVIAAPCRALVFHQGALFVGSIRGLARIGPKGAEEILDDNGSGLGYVYSLHIGPRGELWIATLGRGLFRYDGKKACSIAIDTMSDNSNVYAVTHDKAQNLYIAHDNLITKRNDNGNCKVLIEPGPPIAAWTIKWFEGGNLVAGSSDGLNIYDDHSGETRNRISGSFEDIPWEFTTSRSVEVINNHKLYCGLGSGLRVVDLNDLSRKTDTPTAVLSEINWFGTTPDESADIPMVPTGHWRLTAEIATSWYLDDCLMRYRLDGFDDHWSDYKSPSEITYTSLPPGNYGLDVEVRSPLAGTGGPARLYNFIVK